MVDTFVTHPDILYSVALDLDGDGDCDETLTCTGTHPFYVCESSSFCPASELLPGSHLLRADSRGNAVVQGITCKLAPVNATFTTYNFAVDCDHTYFVGKSRVWVHNSGWSACPAFYAHMEEMREILTAGNYITGNGSLAEEWMLLQCAIVDAQQEGKVELALFQSIIKRFRDTHSPGGLIDVPSVPFSATPTGNAVYRIGGDANNGIQYHHWWPKEWLPDALKEAANYNHGLTIPLATPTFHTSNPAGLQPAFNRFMRERLGGLSKKDAREAFLQKTFAEQKKLVGDFYAEHGLRIPDFTSPGLVD